MAGGRQAPSGTAFDPRPQFQVHEIISSGPLTVTGRCMFAPVTVGAIFTALETLGVRHSPTAQCRLHVEEISVYGRPADELDQVMSARLALGGDIPPGLAPRSALIAVASPETGRWQRAGSVWIRVPR